MTCFFFFPCSVIVLQCRKRLQLCFQAQIHSINAKITAWSTLPTKPRRVTTDRPPEAESFLPCPRCDVVEGGSGELKRLAEDFQRPGSSLSRTKWGFCYPQTADGVRLMA